MKEKYTLYMDDTGFNAFEKKSKSLQKESATCVGVLIHQEDELIIEAYMQELCSHLKNKFDTDEFHFTEIYNRKGNFKNIDIEETLEILEVFAKMFNLFDLTVFVHTFNKEEKNDNEKVFISSVKILSELMGLPNDDKTVSMLTTFIKARAFVSNALEDSEVNTLVSDEGIMKAGTEVLTPDKQIKIMFDSSSSNKLLQLADYAAWYITRVKNIMDKVPDKKGLSEIDKRVLQIYNSLSDCYIGLSKVNLNLDEMSDFSYDKMMENFKNEIK